MMLRQTNSRPSGFNTLFDKPEFASVIDHQRPTLRCRPTLLPPNQSPEVPDAFPAPVDRLPLLFSAALCAVDHQRRGARFSGVVGDPAAVEGLAAVEAVASLFCRDSSILPHQLRPDRHRSVERRLRDASS